MSLPEPSNEQKLTYIYQTLKAQEARRKRKIVMNFLKWILLLSLLYFAYTYRVLIFERSYAYATNYIQVQIAKYSEKQKAGILRGIQEIIPPNLVDTIKQITATGSSATGSSTPAKKK